MDLDTVVSDFKSKVCEQLRLTQEGENRFRVFTPFMFEDGDHLAIVLKREQGYWMLSDEGHTYMHLTYDLDEKDLRTGTRQKIITNALSAFSVTDRAGELLTPIREGHYGDALYSFVQALLRVADVTFLTRERVKSTFLEDFREFIEKTVAKERRIAVQHILQLVQRAVQVLVGAALLVDLGNRVHHRGVVLVAELAADLRQAGFGHLLGQVHGDLPRHHHVARVVLLLQVGTRMPNCSATAR
jgi:hypothetical protein